jgi:putative membrane protein
MFDKPHRLHPAAILINFGQYFIATAKALAIPLVGILFSGRRNTQQFMVLIVGGFIAFIGAIALIGPVLHFLSTTFYIESEALVISSGFVWRKRRTIPLARIQNVNVERTLWHRILGAAAVKVETAAGAKTEGDLTALSLADANMLQAVLLQRRGAPAETAEVMKPAPLYELSPKQVLLAGALGNRVLYIVASIMAVFQFEGSHRLFRPLLDYMEKLGPAAAVAVGALSFVVLIVVGWLLSIGISATRFYGFRIEKHERGLLLTHGLITQFRTVVPLGRIQDVRIVEPVLFRALGYCEVYADTAGSFDKKDLASANKICPILPEGGVSRIGKLLLPEFEFEQLSWRQVSPKTVARHAFRNFISLAIFMAFPLGYWLKWHALWAAVPLALYCWMVGVIYYRYVGYAFTNDILVSRRGVFRKQAVMIPFDRIQHYTINSSLFQRWLGLGTVTAISASSAGHPIHIADIELTAAETLRKTIGLSIRNHLGARRGGL